MFLQMKRYTTAILPVSLLLLYLSGPSSAATAQTQASSDNSVTNKAQTQAATADQQKNNHSDRELTAEIRRAVIADKSLSVYGHNVKIIVTGGSATLKGPVHSDAEKQAIGQTAAVVVGADKVSNEITIK